MMVVVTTVIEKIANILDFIIKCIKYLLNVSQASRKTFNDRMEVLEDPSCEPIGKYIKTILKHYVKRNVYFYNDVRVKKNAGRPVRYFHVVRQLTKSSGTKNFFLVGPEGSGKSTLLKKLYAYTNIRGYTYLYFHANMTDVQRCHSIDGLLRIIEERILSSKSKCVVFIDGLDEFRCLLNTNEEFEKVLDYILGKNSTDNNGPHKFVVSTRPEHFLIGSSILRRKAPRNMDHFCFYELKDLDKKDSVAIAKSVRFLYNFDQKGNTSHFKDKWPSSSDEGLSKRRYLKNLKKYCENNSDASLLNTPLMCRYAYTVVCDWVNDGSKTEIVKTEEDRIIELVKKLIKWEYHDAHKRPTNDGSDDEYRKYEIKVLSFLAVIAGKMGEKNRVDADTWNTIRNNRNLSTNQALCVLQEVKSQDGSFFMFTHKSFLDYFQACYYAWYFTKKDDWSDYIVSNIKRSAMFSDVFFKYYKQYNKDDRRKRVFNFFEKKPGLNEKIKEYAINKEPLPFVVDGGFTAEDYFFTFPRGSLLLEELQILDKKEFDNTLVSKTFFIKHPMLLDGILKKHHIVNDMNAIDTIWIDTSADSSMNSLDVWAHFDMRGAGTYIYTTKTYNELFTIFDEQQEILSELIKAATSSNRYVAIKALEEANKETVQKTSKKLEDSLRNASSFLNGGNDYLGLWYDQLLYVYPGNHILPKRIEDWILDINKEEKPFYAIRLLGGIGSYLIPPDSIETYLKFVPTSQVNYLFDYQGMYFEKMNTVLSDYYSLFCTTRLLWNEIADRNTIGYDSVSKIDRALFIFNQITAISKSNLLKLCCTDELLIIYYLTKRYEEAKSLSTKTITDCEQYGHKIGIKLRYYFINHKTGQDDIPHDFITSFVFDYAWLPQFPK